MLRSICLLCVLTLTQLVWAVRPASLKQVSEWSPKRPEKPLTNAERFKRGLKPNTPRKLYNATATRPALARRSPMVYSGYVRSVPATTGTNGSPFDTVSYLYYSPEEDAFRLSTDPTQADLFQWYGAGIEQYLYANHGGTVYQVCAHVISQGTGVNMYGSATGGYTTANFASCPIAYQSQSESEAYGAYYQAPIWGMNPAEASGQELVSWFFNSDQSITAFSLFWVFSNNFYSQALGLALDGSEFPGETNYASIDLYLISTLPV
ncbi:hypothetical protein TREMEDRAFT_63556 [Tremella mesenterica DSM 1558]|uniref:uncharacterized protein n=1 Tax=Tremella mesenterica (strain ATCC 24925 / CBS 8224 / DSM 1558 / NBRC 9311 / NRRL Y-6157 / RJB 2259-6 / UBC 559-6) TaxID=578456 RepID=UPI0003F4A0BD|nr:uncharacterized protein TREMEDRAFT_63556 [Tremella mesenterica DSM 1558]EIW68387.1 hypothetical protein TREMEDRAFT_63556 [Tremella mesenterica DSM 1558]